MRTVIEICIISLPGPLGIENAMHLNSTASSSRCRSRMTGLLLIFCCLTGSILAQTFQYSRGWTNGRKRSGPSPQMLIPSSASGERLFQNTDESSAISNPCSQLQRIRFLLGARNPQQVNGGLIHCCCVCSMGFSVQYTELCQTEGDY